MIYIPRPPFTQHLQRGNLLQKLTVCIRIPRTNPIALIDTNNLHRYNLPPRILPTLIPLIHSLNQHFTLHHSSAQNYSPLINPPITPLPYKLNQHIRRRHHTRLLRPFNNASLRHLRVLQGPGSGGVERDGMGVGSIHQPQSRGARTKSTGRGGWGGAPPVLSQDKLCSTL